MKSKLIFLGTIVPFFLLIIALQGFSVSYSGDDGKKVSINGEVLDMQCYASSGAHGADHKECGTGCVKGGAPIGLLDKDGKVYLLVKDEKSAGDFPKLADHVSDMVTVTGTEYDRGGIRSVVVATVAQASK